MSKESFASQEKKQDIQAKEQAPSFLEVEFVMAQMERDDLISKREKKELSQSAKAGGIEEVVQRLLEKAGDNEELREKLGGWLGLEQVESSSQKNTKKEAREEREVLERDIEKAKKQAADMAKEGVRRVKDAGGNKKDVEEMQKAGEELINGVEELAKETRGEVEEAELERVSSEKEQVVDEKEAQQIETELNISDRLEEKFSKFGISSKDLESVEGFNELSDGRKHLIAENLAQMTYARVQELARDKYQDHVMSGNIMQRFWRSVTKKYQLAKFEKKKAVIMGGGMSVHGDILNVLVEAAKNGPEARVAEDGSPDIQAISGYKEMSAEAQEVVERFNAVAAHFMRTPQEWRYETAPKPEQEKYRKLHEQYQSARNELLIAVYKEYNDEKLALEIVNRADAEVTMQQFFVENEDVENELLNIKEKKIFTKAIGNVITERGLYFGAGYATRSLAMGALGAIGLPIATAASGGYFARKRAKESLRERDVAARQYGKEDTSETAKNFVDADQQVEKLIKLIEEVEDEGDNRFRSYDDIKQVIELKLEVDLPESRDEFLKNIDELIPEDFHINYIGEEEPLLEMDKKFVKDAIEKQIQKEKLSSKLKVRAAYVESKLSDGLMSYGKTAQERIVNELNLMQELARARTLSCTAENGTELEKRLARYLEYKKGEIDWKRFKDVSKKTLKGAVYGATFGFAGYLISDVFGGAESSEAVGVSGVDVPSDPEPIPPPEAPEPPIVPSDMSPEAVADVPKTAPLSVDTPQDAAAMFDSTVDADTATADLQPGDTAGFEAASGIRIEDSGEIVLTPEHVEYQGGTSVWDEIERQVGGRELFDEVVAQSDEAQLTYLVDYLKDRIVENPQEYGLEGNIDVDALTQDQLRNLDWDRLFADLYTEEGLEKALPELSDEVKRQIVENNRTLSEYTAKTGESLDTETVYEVLRGAQEAGSVDEYLDSVADMPVGDGVGRASELWPYEDPWRVEGFDESIAETGTAEAAAGEAGTSDKSVYNLMTRSLEVEPSEFYNLKHMLRSHGFISFDRHDIYQSFSDMKLEDFLNTFTKENLREGNIDWQTGIPKIDSGSRLLETKEHVVDLAETLRAHYKIHNDEGWAQNTVRRFIEKIVFDR